MKTASQAPHTLSDILKLCDEDLQKVEAGLVVSAKSALPLVDDINKYLHKSGGKRFRPLFLLLSSRLCGFKGESVMSAGVVVELIHVATLVHDDIIDDAYVRRGRPSVNAKWGNQVTVLAGDWLYMTSFALALELRNFRVLDTLISITRKMVEGELMQLEQSGRLDISMEKQLEICERKTADLFSGCGRLGAILAGVGPKEEKRLASCGRSLGMAFQLIDDLLDYTSSEDTLGKPVLKDLQEGKATLPIICLMQRATQEEVKFIREVFIQKDFTRENREEIVRLVGAYGVLEECRHQAEKYVFRAKDQLLEFPDSIYREAMIKLAELVITREN